MKTKIFFVAIFFFYNLDHAFADCASQADKAKVVCDKANVKDVEKLAGDLKAILNKKDTGASSTLESSIASGTQAKIRTDKFAVDCAIAWKNCVSVCENEANQRYSNQDNAGGRSAEELRNYCAGEPAENQKAAEAASGNMQQMLPGLMQLLASLKGTGGENGDLCSREPNNPQCKTDVAAQTSSGPITNNEARPSDEGSFLETGVNGNDTPAMGERTDPSLAQGTPGIGGGSGINSAGLAGGSGRSKGVAEGPSDMTPKINLASAGGGGGGARSTSPLGGGLAPSKTVGNPIATRTSIDGDNKAGIAAMDKAMQARGLASENGQLGGVSAAHSFDNFQKIDKRIQAERNHLNER